MKTDFIINISQALKAVRENLLRSTLTVALIAIGITALVGILTAIDGVQQSIFTGLSDLGATSFDIRDRDNSRRQRRRGEVRKVHPPITRFQANQFAKRYDGAGIVSLSTNVTGTAEVKAGKKKTNPNSRVTGVNENYVSVKNLDLQEGRDFSQLEIEKAAPVVIIGSEVATTLFGSASAVNQQITFLGQHFKVIGVLKERGGLGQSNSSDRTLLIPMDQASVLSQRELRFTLSVLVKEASQLEGAMGEATGTFRTIRKDKPGSANSFEISRSETLATSINETSDTLRIGGFFIGILTLLGASIGLMNIMLVSVTERTREIGLRKSIGATAAHIQRQFLMEAVVICQIGGLIGVLLGLAVGNVVTRFVAEEAVFTIPWVWIVSAFITCIFVGIVAGYYPAWKASRLDPIEALRHS